MALSKTSMKNKIKSAINAVPSINDVDFSATFGGTVTMEEVLEAFCQGIIDEITTNGAVLQGNDSDGSIEVPGTIT